MRDYDPAMGRYVQSDPIGLSGGTNPYTYVASRPLMAVDRLGLLPRDPSNVSRDVRVTPSNLNAPEAGRLLGLDLSDERTPTVQPSDELCAVGSPDRLTRCRLAAHRCIGHFMKTKPLMIQGCMSQYDRCIATNMYIIFPDGSVVSP